MGKCQGKLKQPEGMTPTEMQPFWREPTKYLVPDGMLYSRQETNKPPAMVSVSAAQK